MTELAGSAARGITGGFHLEGRRRFMGGKRIRHYGLLGSAHKTANLAAARPVRAVLARRAHPKVMCLVAE